jgi:aryl-alcohol dehydrogenase-like predicted oxidoreductase
MASRQAKSKNACSKDKQGSQIRPKAWTVADKHYIVGDRCHLLRQQTDVIPVLRELGLGIGLVPFCPLGRGFLTGEVKRAEEYPEGDFRPTDPRDQGENNDANVKAARIVHDIAEAKANQTYLKFSEILSIPSG